MEATVKEVTPTYAPRPRPAPELSSTPQPPRERSKFICVNDILNYTQTLVKSGILRNNGISLPCCPLQLQEILGIVVAVRLGKF